MRKNLGNKMNFLSLPVLMIGTYDKDGKQRWFKIKRLYIINKNNIKGLIKEQTNSCNY